MFQFQILQYGCNNNHFSYVVINTLVTDMSMINDTQRRGKEMANEEVMV